MSKMKHFVVFMIASEKCRVEITTTAAQVIEVQRGADNSVFSRAESELPFSVTVTDEYGKMEAYESADIAKTLEWAG